jgi:hypothetical protein
MQIQGGAYPAQAPSYLQKIFEIDSCPAQQEPKSLDNIKLYMYNVLPKRSVLTC